MSDDTLQLALEALEASIDDVRECLDDLRPHSGWARYDKRIEAYQAQIERHELAIEGVKAMIAERALQAMAANARELGLTYDASVVRIDTSPERVEKEAENKDVRPPNCGTGYCSCIECLFEQPAPAQEPMAPETDKVICPNCVHQFRAIPVDVQKLMLDAGFEPPFTTPPAPAQEPVIQDWMKPDALCDRSCLYACTEGFTKFPTCVPPPAHTCRIGLTDEEFVELCSADLGTAALIRAVEAKLKEKNTKGGT
jgi:hypothetical protein